MSRRDDLNGSRAAPRGPGAPISRRGMLAGGAASVALAGCASPVPSREAEASHPPIGTFVTMPDGLQVHAWRRDPADPARADARPAVLIHGASGNLRDWTFQIAERIAEERPVIAFDRPGFGYTDRPAGGEHPAEQARVLRRALARMEVEEPILVGHSYGAAVAMAWALDAPESVAGVVPVSGVTMPYGGFGRIANAIGLSSLISWAYTEYIKSTVENGGVERFLARAFRPQSPPPGYADYVGAPLALREETLQANARDLETINAALREMAPRYPEMRMPVEILHGTADFIDADKQAVGLHAQLPGSRLTLLEGVGHMAHHVRTDALVAALARIDSMDRA